MIKRLKAYLKKNKTVFKITYSIYYALMCIIYRVILLCVKMDERSVVFISFMGEQYSDNPRALYEEMIGDNKYGDFNCYWIFKEPQKFRDFEILKSAKIIGYTGFQYYYALAKSKYIISNSRIKNEIRIRKDQIYVQTWHGTPLKKLGFDIGVGDFKDIGGDKKNLVRNYLSDSRRYGFFLSPSPYFTEKLSSAFGIKNKSIFLELGYPRNDFLYSYKDSDIEKIKNELNIKSNKKIILYAPTFRETDLKNNRYEQTLMLDLKDLKESIGDEYTVLLRLHYYVSNRLDLSKYKGFATDVSTYYDIARLYVISDILLTDYSSVFFDYAILKRRIIFYMYDMQLYNQKMHDFYIGLKELPGEIVNTQEELINEIKHGTSRVSDMFNAKFNPHTGKCSGAYLERIIRNEA